MKEFKYTITDPVGIHARPAGILVKEVKKYASSFTIISPEGKEANLTKLLAVMGLGIKQGQEVTIRSEGEDEAAAAEAIEKFFKENF